jgi:PAS domain S-box-containing protein
MSLGELQPSRFDGDGEALDAARLTGTGAARAELEELRDFVDNAAVGLHRAGPDGLILWANRAELELLGYDAGEYVGRSIAEFHADPHVAAEMLARLSKGEALRDHEARLRAKDGSVRHVLISANACFRDGKFVHARCVTRDVTESKSSERERAETAARAERLIKVTTAVADAVTEGEVFEALVDNVASAVNASSAALWVPQDDGRTVRLARSFGYHEAARQGFEQLSVDAPGASPVIDAILRGEPVWIPSREALLRAYPHLRGSAVSGRNYRVSCLPLVAQGRIVGALGITVDDAAGAADVEEEQGFLTLVAWYAGQALERLRLLAAERDSRKVADAAAARLLVLSRASRTFVTADFDLPARMTEIAREIGVAVGGSSAISLIGRDRQLATAAVYHPIREAHYALETLATTTRLRVGEGVSAAVARTGESTLVPEPDERVLASEVAPAYRAFLNRYPIYAMMCAPLRVGRNVIGTVTATRVHAGETYTRQELVFLEELADRAAPAIENSRLHAEIRSALSRSDQLYRFAKAVVAAEKVDEVFEAALDAIEHGLGSTRGAILISDEKGVMRFRASRNLSPRYRDAVEGHSPWPPDAVAPEPVLVPNVETDKAMTPFLPLFHEEGIRSLAFIPLVTRGRLIGKFMLYFSERHTYTSSEIELASAIAHHLASVVARFEAMAKLEDTIRTNDLFAGVLAHDLRNPLGAMMTAAQMVLMRQEGRGDPDAKPLNRILSSGTRIFRMIDQLLDVTRARVGGGIQLEPRETNLGQLCDQAIGELELANQEWDIKRTVVGDLNGKWDPDRLLQIISNLVGNAGQHGDQGHPIVVRLDGRLAETVTLEVRNHGVVPEAMMANLFDPLRGGSARGDLSRGLGRGLFIG